MVYERPKSKTSEIDRADVQEEHANLILS